MTKPILILLAAGAIAAGNLMADEGDVDALTSEIYDLKREVSELKDKLDGGSRVSSGHIPYVPTPEEEQWREWIYKQYGELGLQRGRLAKLELDAERRGDHDAAMKYREEAEPITDKIAQIRHNLEYFSGYDTEWPIFAEEKIPKALPVK
jgi:hypothetical protein